MKNHRTVHPDLILILYTVTTLGSWFSSIATYLSIEPAFGSVMLLGLALGLRTVGNSLFSLRSGRIVSKHGFRKSLLESQAAGLLMLALYAYGFAQHTFAPLAIGVALGGMPLALFSVLTLSSLRLEAESPAHYRRLSGSMELINGLCMLAASLLAPIAIRRFGLQKVFLFDALTFASCIILGLIMKSPKNINAQDGAMTALTGLPALLRRPATRLFLLRFSASGIIAAFIPVLASSSEIGLTRFVPTWLRESLWSIEAINVIGASALYVVAHRLMKHRLATATMTLSALLVLAVVYLRFSLPLFLVGCFAVSTTTLLALMIFRDDLILSAGENSALIRELSAGSQVIQMLIKSASPIALSFLFVSLNPAAAAATLVGYQLILGVFAVRAAKKLS